MDWNLKYPWIFWIEVTSENSVAVVASGVARRREISRNRKNCCRKWCYFKMLFLVTNFPKIV